MWGALGGQATSAFQPAAAPRVEGLGVCKLASGPQQDSAALSESGDPPVSEALGSPTRGSRFCARGVATAGDVAISVSLGTLPWEPRVRHIMGCSILQTQVDKALTERRAGTSPSEAVISWNQLSKQETLFPGLRN